jgi:hypothetical protein
MIGNEVLSFYIAVNLASIHESSLFNINRTFTI